LLFVGIFLSDQLDAGFRGVPRSASSHSICDTASPTLGCSFHSNVVAVALEASFFAAAGLCVPSSLWLEPRGTHEQVGFLCWTAALLCVLGFGISIARVFRAVDAALRYTRGYLRAGWEIHVSGESRPLLVIDCDAPLLAVIGVPHPRIVVSRGVLRELPSQQLDAALGHEQAHRASRDNVKRLLILLAPEVFPFCRCFAMLERRWARLTEWAAEDEAIAGDSRRSLSLASALVRAARMELPVRPAGIPICFVAKNSDLPERADCLLRDNSTEDYRVRRIGALVGSAVVVIGILEVAMLQPFTLYYVHQALEHLVR
jgi:Peptidase family M48